jgi:hypothetical protein
MEFILCLVGNRLFRSLIERIHTGQYCHSFYLCSSIIGYTLLWVFYIRTNYVA